MNPLLNESNKKTAFNDAFFAANTLGEKGRGCQVVFASSGFLDVIRNSEMVNQIVCTIHRHTSALRSLFSRSEI